MFKTIIYYRAWSIVRYLCNRRLCRSILLLFHLYCCHEVCLRNRCSRGFDWASCTASLIETFCLKTFVIILKILILNTVSSSCISCSWLLFDARIITKTERIVSLLRVNSQMASSLQHIVIVIYFIKASHIIFTVSFLLFASISNRIVKWFGFLNITSYLLVLWGIRVFEFKCAFKKLKSLIYLTFVYSKASWSARTLAHISLLENLNVSVMNWWILLKMIIMTALWFINPTNVIATNQGRLLYTNKLVFMSSH